MYYRIIIFILLYSWAYSLVAQDNSLRLTEEMFIELVMDHHPVAKQSRLINERGKYGLRKARGNFDPYVFATFDNKYFQDKEYFSLLGTGLKIPTWLGLDIKAGFDQNQGLFLNPENYLPENGLWYAGVSLPLGEGLFIDERRKTLQQARLFTQYADVEQQVILNNLFFDALSQYWSWVQSYIRFQIFEESVGIAQVRFDAVKNSYLQGDKPAIDTLEAHIQIQNRLIGSNQAELDFQKETLQLSNYLWFGNDLPLEMDTDVIPAEGLEIRPGTSIGRNDLDSLLITLDEIHPELQMYNYRLADLNIEQRWKREKIKPKLNLDYNLLYESVGNTLEAPLVNNYKWGVRFSMPLFLRSETGDLRLNEIKMQETRFKQTAKEREITNKIISYYQQYQNLRGQIRLYQSNVNNYENLLSAERRRFSIGESSLFLINSREMSLIESRIKLIETLSKLRITHTGFYWASGSLALRLTTESNP